MVGCRLKSRSNLAIQIQPYEKQAVLGPDQPIITGDDGWYSRHAPIECVVLDADGEIGTIHFVATSSTAIGSWLLFLTGATQYQLELRRAKCHYDAVCPEIRRNWPNFSQRQYLHSKSKAGRYIIKWPDDWDYGIGSAGTTISNRFASKWLRCAQVAANPLTRNSTVLHMSIIKIMPHSYDKFRVSSNTTDVP
ncbi:hypothetical protein CHU98_g7854 [Xylaria longipes]|nr:hypothetical protein CHU98_g7854 [Xylaria longipes]